jgi:predicted small metal-binding protein
MKYLLISTSVVATVFLQSLTFGAAAAVFRDASDAGQRFNLERVRGDGNCAFNAIGCSRAEVVTALTQHVMEHEQAQQAQAILSMITNNSSDAAVVSAISLADTLVANIGLHYSSNPGAVTLATRASNALDAFRGQMHVRNLSSFDTQLNDLRQALQAAYADRYDGFNVALISELAESGLAVGELNTATQIVAAIERVFARNAGVGSWLPVGLIFGVAERLNLHLAVWSTRGTASGQVVLYQTNALGEGGWHERVRHVVWHGNHYDRLLAIN